MNKNSKSAKNTGKNIKFESIIKDLNKLPTLPGIAMKILKAVRNKETGLKEIGEILATDPVLSAEVLKAINSHFYSLPNKITTVPHAVTLMGINTVKNLALSFSLVKNNKPKKSDGFDYSNFWRKSLIGAVSAKILTKDILPEFTEDAFFLGLIHNIGTLAMNQCIPQQYQLVLNEKKSTTCADHEAEIRVLGLDHMQLGEFLVESWGLPETFSIPIRYHHRFDEMQIGDPYIDNITKMLQLASLFIDLNEVEGRKLHIVLAQLEFLVNKYGFQDKVQIDEAAKQIHRQTDNILPLFNITIKEDGDYLKLIEEARSELIRLSSDLTQQFLEQKKLIEYLSKQATTDSLTGLLNFGAFQKSLDAEIERAARYRHDLCLIMADIDQFKNINDKYGHPAGDHILRLIAEFIKNDLRASDIAARYGGEEFAIILPETSKTDAINVAERIRMGIESFKIEYNKQIISVSMSFGVSSFNPPKEVDKITLIREADDALYQAKGAGRNTCKLFRINNKG